MKTLILYLLALALLVTAAEPKITAEESGFLKQIQQLSPQQADDLLAARLTPASSPALHFALATMKLQANHHQQAIPPLKQALKLMPDFHRARWLLAQTYARLEDFSACEQELTTLLQHPTAPRSHETWALLAHAYAQQKRLLPAENAIRSAITLHPQNLPYQRLLLSLLLQQRQYSQAASLARQLLPHDHHQELTWLALVNQPLQQQQLQEASQLLTIACTVLPDSIQLLQLQASILMQLRLFEPAARILLKLQTQHALPIEQALSGIRALLAAGHQTTAKRLLDQLGDKNLTPRQQLDYEKLRTNLNLTGEPDHDLKLWQHIITLEPHDTDALFHIAQAQHALKRHDDALQTAQKIIRLSPHHFESHILIANIHLTLNNRPKALDAMRKAYRIFPSSELEHTIQQLQIPPRTNTPVYHDLIESPFVPSEPSKTAE